MISMHRVSPALSGFLLLAGVLVAPYSASAQDQGEISLSSISIPRPSYLSPYADPEGSRRLLGKLRKNRPGDLRLHIAAARETAALGMLAGSREKRRAFLAEAVEAARAAVALDSTDVEANYWLAASLGLLADHQGIRARISLAREAHERVLLTLELDPSHGGGHHVLGRLHAGARRLSWASRVVARGLGLGAILDEASWESAEHHMRLAAEEDPDQLAHLYELAKLLVEARGKRDEGLAILKDVATRTPRHAVDAYYSARAGRALDRFLDDPGEPGTGTVM